MRYNNFKKLKQVSKKFNNIPIISLFPEIIPTLPYLGLNMIFVKSEFKPNIFDKATQLYTP